MGTKFNTSFVLPNGFDLGGVTSWSMRLADCLGKSGKSAILIKHVDRCAEHSCTPSTQVRVIECTHSVHPNYWFLRSKDIDGYYRSYVQTLPSVFIPNYSFGSYAACARIAGEYPDQIRVVGMAHTDSEQYYRWLVRFEPIIHTFVAVSREIEEKLAALLPHRQEDIVQHPCGVDVDNTFSREYSRPSQPLQIIYAGRLTERQKRVSDLVRLAVQLREKQVDFELHLYGDGRDRLYLERLINSLREDVHDRITAAGYVEPQKMAQLYRMADILVLVSEYEGASLSMLESMAQGCIPVVSRVSGTSQIVEQYRNGFTVPVGAVDKMAEKIAWLDRHRDQLPDIGKLAHATIREHYSYRTYVPWFSEIIDGTCQKAPRPGRTEGCTNFYIPFKEVLKEAGYTLASRRGLRWLYYLKEPARKLLH